MSATFNTAIVSVTDWMRNQLADIDTLTFVSGTSFTVVNPVFQDETYAAYYADFGAVEGLSQLAQALLIQYQNQGEDIKQADVDLDFTQRMKALETLIKDLRGGRIVPPGGPALVGAAAVGISDVTPLNLTQTFPFIPGVIPTAFRSN